MRLAMTWTWHLPCTQNVGLQTCTPCSTWSSWRWVDFYILGSGDPRFRDSRLSATAMSRTHILVAKEDAHCYLRLGLEEIPIFMCVQCSAWSLRVQAELGRQSKL